MDNVSFGHLIMDKLDKIEMSISQGDLSELGSPLTTIQYAKEEILKTIIEEFES